MTTIGRPFTLTTAEHKRVEQIDELVARGAGGVEQLIDHLSDPSWTVRRAAVASLAVIGDDAVRALCDWLRSARTSEHAIAAAVDALVGSTGATATQAVIDLLDHATPAVVADGAQILGRRRAREAAGALGKLLEHADDNVAVSAIEALDAIGGTLAIDALIAVLPRGNFFRTFPVLQVLANTGDPRVVAPIATLLQNDTFRNEAARALGRTGSPLAIAPLAALLASPSAALAKLVAISLAELVARAEWNGAAEQLTETLGATISNATDRFVAALRDADLTERIAIVKVLARIADGRIVAALAGLLGDPELHDCVIDALRRIGRRHDDALIAILSSADPTVRAAVLPAVNSSRAAPRLRELLADDESEVRARACEALARLGDTTVVPQLFALLGDPSSRVAHAASAAIHSLGVAETGALAIAALGSPNPAVRRQALRIISYIGDPKAFDAVCAALADPDPRIAEHAVGALANLEDPRVDAMLGELAESTNETIRAAAMRGAALRPGEPVLRLLERGVTDRAAWVRYYACQGLGRIGRGVSTELLVGLLADATPHVRIAAIEALAHLDTPSAWQALCSAARSDDPDQQRAALVGIGLAPRAAALPFLLEGLQSEDTATRLIVLSGLARSPEPIALAALAKAITHRAPEVCDATLSLLAERQDRGAADVLVDAALTTELVHPAHFALSRPGAARIAAIVARLADIDDRGATILVAALARMADHGATTAMFDQLVSANPAARLAAATTLIATGAPGAAAVVGRLAKDDPDPSVRRVCAAAIAS